jgi:hypothetical protein
MRFDDRFATFNALQQQSCDAWLELRARGLAIVCKHQSGDLLLHQRVAALRVWHNQPLEVDAPSVIIAVEHAELPETRSEDELVLRWLTEPWWVALGVRLTEACAVVCAVVFESFRLQNHTVHQRCSFIVRELSCEDTRHWSRSRLCCRLPQLFPRTDGRRERTKT